MSDLPSDRPMFWSGGGIGKRLVSRFSRNAGVLDCTKTRHCWFESSPDLFESEQNVLGGSDELRKSSRKPSLGRRENSV